MFESSDILKGCKIFSSIMLAYTSFECSDNFKGCKTDEKTATDVENVWE